MGALLQGGKWPYASSWKGSLTHDRLLFIGRSGGRASYPEGLVDVDIGAKVAGPGAIKAASIHRRAGGGDRGSAPSGMHRARGKIRDMDEEWRGHGRCYHMIALAACLWGGGA